MSGLLRALPAASMLPKAPPWRVTPWEDALKQVNTYVLFELGRWLDSCFVSAGQPLAGNIRAWVYASEVLSRIVGEPESLWLTGQQSADDTTRTMELARDLKGAVEDAICLYKADPTAVLSAAARMEFEGVFNAFTQALSDGLPRAETYHIEAFRAYATRTLMTRGQLVLAENVRSALPEAVLFDMNQAARCLACRLSTASGLHAVRAVEGALRHWYLGEMRVTREPGERTPGMETMIKRLVRTRRGDPALGVLSRFRRLYRNRLAHADMFLSEDEACEVFGLAVMTITVVATAMSADTSDG